MRTYKLVSPFLVRTLCRLALESRRAALLRVEAQKVEGGTLLDRIKRKIEKNRKIVELRHDINWLDDLGYVSMQERRQIMLSDYELKVLYSTA